MNITTTIKQNLDNPGFIPDRPLSKIIGEVAVIASVQVSSLGMSRLDRRASAESDIAHGAKDGTGKVNVNRLPGAEVKVDAIKAKHTQARSLVSGRTTRWGKDRRLLMNEFIGELCGEMDEIIREHDALRDDFVADSWAYIQMAQRNLGSYDIQPPTMSEIENAFSLSLELAPVPDVSAYTTGDSALEQAMKARFEADIQAAYQGAQKDLLKRLAEPLENMISRMDAYDRREANKANGVKVGKTDTFKSTIITNITDIAKLFRSFNITNDPFLVDVTNKLEAFEEIEHEDLTNSATLRRQMARQASEIRAQLGDWL